MQKGFHQEELGAEKELCLVQREDKDQPGERKKAPFFRKVWRQKGSSLRGH